MGEMLGPFYFICRLLYADIYRDKDMQIKIPVKMTSFLPTALTTLFYFTSLLSELSLCYDEL